MTKSFLASSSVKTTGDLLNAFERFRQDCFANDPAPYQVGNKPHTMLITCSDSRILPERLFGIEPGEIFVHRNAGNIVPPYGQAVSGEIATIEYAVEGLGVRNIVICGHVDCGAMKAVVDPALAADMPSVTAWLKHSETARKVACGCGHHTKEALLSRVIEENILAQLDHLRTVPAVAAKLRQTDEQGTCLQLHGWLYDNVQGTLKVYDPLQKAFIAAEASALETLTTPAVLAAQGTRRQIL